MDEHLDREPEGPATDPWAAAAPRHTGPGADPGDTADVAAQPRTEPRAAVAPPGDPRLAQRTSGRQVVAVVASVTALALAAGAVGYLLGDHNPTLVRTPNGFSLSPFGSSGSSGVPGFRFPNFGELPGGQSSSSTAPKAVTQEEKALVDVNTTIENGQASGAGTGIVLTSNGIVLTNNHVVDGATSISVTDLGNGQTYGATVVGYDVDGDVAVLRLDGASGLTTATIGAPATVGQTVYAVGNAGGVGGTPTVTSGSITGVSKSVTASDSFDGTSETLHGMLQTSAALISGDSGGALMSKSGAVLGMDTAGSSGPGSAGGFAIPIATALALAHEIEAGATSATVHVGPTALLGVEIRPSSSTTGAPVSGVVAGTPAAAAGITTGSRVTSIGGQTIGSGAALRLAMTTLTVGTKVTVTWVDAQGTTHSATVTLASGPPQ